MAAAMVFGAPQPVAAQADTQEMETRIGEEGFVSPPASLAQLDWLVGQWVGAGIQGAPAMESWLPPAGGTMVGTFVQEQVDEEEAAPAAAAPRGRGGRRGRGRGAGRT